MDRCWGVFPLPDIWVLPIRAMFDDLSLSEMAASLLGCYLFQHAVDTAIVDSNLCIV